MSREAYSPTAEVRARVRELFTRGMSKRAIARELGISDNTLRKHHFADFSVVTEVCDYLTAEQLGGLRSKTYAALEHLLERTDEDGHLDPHPSVVIFAAKALLGLQEGEEARRPPESKPLAACTDEELEEIIAERAKRARQQREKGGGRRRRAAKAATGKK